MAKAIAQRITKHVWRTMVLTSVISIIFGLFALFWPDLTLAILISMVGIFAIVMGVMWSFESLARMRTHRLWWLELPVAIAVIALGVFLLMNPDAATRIFAFLLAAFVFTQAVLDFAAVSYAGGKGKAMWVITGILGVVLGVLLVSRPTAAIVALVWVIGFYAILRGIMSLGFAFSLRDRIGKKAR